MLCIKIQFDQMEIERVKLNSFLISKICVIFFAFLVSFYCEFQILFVSLSKIKIKY